VHDRTRATHRVAPTCTTGSTLTRRCAPASPCQGEAFLRCFVGNSRQLSLRSLNRPNPTGGQCRGDPVGRPCGAARALGPRWLVRSRRAQRCQGDAPRRGRTGCGGCPGTALTTCPLHGSIASDRRKACLCGRSSRATRLRHGTAVPLHHAETRVVRTILHPTAGQCRGDRITPASSAGTLRESAEEAQPQYWSSAVGAVLVVGH
jgi:hypothetical protein